MSIEKFAEKFGLETITESSRNYTSTSKRETLIKKLEREINLLTERQSLEYDRKKEGLKRFWRQSSKDESIGKVCLKDKNKIYNFGGESNQHKPTYFECEYTVESVLNKLNELLDIFQNQMTDEEFNKEFVSVDK